MKYILLLTLSFSALAAFPLMKFENLYGEYENNEGRAYAKSAKYDLGAVKIAHNEIEVGFNKKEKHLIIKDNNTTVELVFDFSFLNVFRSISFDGVSAESTNKMFNLNMDTLNLYIEPKAYKLSNLSIETDISGIGSDELPTNGDIDVLDGFVLNGKIQFKRLSFGSVKKEDFIADLILENPNLEDEINKLAENLANKIPLTLRNFSLSTNRGAISGKVKLDSWVNANLKIGGKIRHIKKQNNLVITLEKAKLGIFSVKRRVLKEIKKLNLDEVTVSGNKIIIDLGKVLTNSSPRS